MTLFLDKIMKAYIAIDTNHGTLLEISLDNGELEHVKPILLEYYNTHESTLSLINLGKLDTLAEKHDDCVYYGRDRKEGEFFNLVYFFGSHEPVWTVRTCHQYFFEKGVWLYRWKGTDEWSKLELQ